MPVLARASSIASIVDDLNQAQEAQVCTAKSQQTKDVHHGPLFHLRGRRRRTKGSVVGEEWCQNAAPLR